MPLRCASSSQRKAGGIRRLRDASSVFRLQHKGIGRLSGETLALSISTCFIMESGGASNNTVGAIGQLKAKDEEKKRRGLKQKFTI